MNSSTSSHDPRVRRHVDRRSVLAGAVAGASSMLLGCRQETQENHSSRAQETPRQDIPLRVAWAGEFEDFETVRRAWSTVSPLPLDITEIKVKRSDAAGFLDALLESAERSDVLVYPLAGVASLYASNAIVPLDGGNIISGDQERGQLYTALRNGASRYAGEDVANPLGGRQPALISFEPEVEITSWTDYDGWVKSLDGQAAEPLADGWAAMMFLWRAATTLDRGWLFEREGLEPLIATPPYVAVLEQMQQTASRYKPGRLDSAQLWSEVQEGTLSGGIGFPAGSGQAGGSIFWLAPPSDLETEKVLLDVFSPVASLPAACRQSASAKQFISWLGGGTGSEVIQGHVSGMSTTRQLLTTTSDQSSTARNDAYQVWLADYLSSAVTVPTLQLLQAGDYYDALDDAIVNCLEKKASAKETLASVDQRWRELTQQIGPQRQQRAWRRAQGMLG